MLLTPVLNGVRIKLNVSESDLQKVTRGPGYKGIVTDMDTWKRYKIYGKACELPRCYCDAKAVEIK